MASGDPGSDVSLLLSESGEHFRRALDLLVEAHCQDMRELRGARALAVEQEELALCKRMAAEHKAWDNPVDEPPEGTCELDERTSERSGRRREDPGASVSVDLLRGPIRKTKPVGFLGLETRPSSRKNTASQKLKARIEARHNVTEKMSGGSQSGVPAGTKVNTDVSATLLNELIPGLKSFFGHNLVQRILTSVTFEVSSACVVLVFCVITALQMQREGLILGYRLGYKNYDDPSTQTAWTVVDEVLQIGSLTCGVLFVMEFVVRALGGGKMYWCDGWCYFDLIMILGWAVELVGEAIGSSGGSRAFRPARLARLLRFIRMINIIRHLESLYFMVRALTGSLKILGWACLLLFAFQTLTAFVITELLNAFFFPREDLGPEAKEVFEYFGSFARSLLTTFEMAMGNWPTPARVLIEHVSEWFILIFLAHKLSVGFAFLGVINAVFIQETFQVANTDDLTMVLKKQNHVATQRQKLEKLFRSADNNNDGRVSREEFTRLLENKDVQMWLASMDYHAGDPDSLFDMLDYNGSGDLSALEFLTGMVVLRGTARAMDLVGLVEMQLEHDQMLRQICQSLPLDGEELRKKRSERSPAEYSYAASLSSDPPYR